MSNSYGDHDPWTPPRVPGADDQQAQGGQTAPAGTPGDGLQYPYGPGVGPATPSSQAWYPQADQPLGGHSPDTAWSHPWPTAGEPAPTGAGQYQQGASQPGSPYQYPAQNTYSGQSPFQGQDPTQPPNPQQAASFVPAGGPPAPYPPQNPWPPQGAPYPGPGAPYSAGSAPYSANGAPWMSYKPGIVSLRPMSLGDVLGGAASLIRFNPKSTIGLSLVVQLFVLALSLIGLAFTHGAPRVGSDGTDGAALSLARGLTSLLSSASSTVLAGLLAYVVAEAVLGRKPGLDATWRASRGRLLAFIGLELMLWLGMVLVIGVVVAAGFITWAATTSVGATVGICLLLGLLALVVVVWLAVRFLVAGPAVIIERLSPIAGFRRSWQLTRGRFWPILGTQVVGSMLAGFASSLLTLPITFVVGLLAGDGDGTGMLAASMIAEALALVLVGPFSAGIQGLLYVDQRMRKEGFDLALQQCADQGSSPWPVDQAVDPGPAASGPWR